MSQVPFDIWQTGSMAVCRTEKHRELDVTRRIDVAIAQSGAMLF